MSNGGGEITREHEELHGKRKFHGDDFAHAIAKIAVSQICESVGFDTFHRSQIRDSFRFDAFQESALEALSDIAARYIHSLGKTAHHYTNLAGRTEGNAFDIVQALEDLGSGLGFTGASDIDHCLNSSGAVRDIIQFVGEAEDISFAYSIPPFPVSKGRKPTPSFLQVGKEPPDEHIPPWLPAFPDPKTYIQSERGDDPDVQKVNQTELDRRKKETESLFLNVQQRSHGDWSEGTLSVDRKNYAKTTQAPESNPFLSAPIHVGEKEVSPVPHPAKLSNEAAGKNPVPENCVTSNHISELEKVASAIKVKQSRLIDSEAGEKKEPVNQRHALRFNIRRVKSSGASINLRSKNKDLQKISPWFSEGEEKDEKEEKEKESQENSQRIYGEYSGTDSVVK